MSFTVAITPKELERQAAAVFEGKAYKAILCVNPGAYDTSNTTAEWEAEEIAASGGYSTLTGTVGTGSYNGTSGKYEVPTISLSWTGSGAGFTYDTLVLIIDAATYPHSVNARVGGSETILDGQPLTIDVNLTQDDA